MTTPAAERLYLAQHEWEHEGKPYAIYNPHGKPLEDLPVIFGFNNGGSPGWYSGCLIAEDGTALGGHVCSHEGYMRHDLGILEGCQPDRHEVFREHYPDGYRMAFITLEDVATHPGLEVAYRRNQAKRKRAEAVIDEQLPDTDTEYLACDGCGETFPEDQLEVRTVNGNPHARHPDDQWDERLCMCAGCWDSPPAQTAEQMYGGPR